MSLVVDFLVATASGTQHPSSSLNCQVNPLLGRSNAR